MTDLEQAVVEVSLFLQEQQIPHMLIGGLAVSRWQEPRATLDADFSLWVEPQHRIALADRLLARFSSSVSEPLPLLARTNVLPVLASGVRVDLVFALLPFERAMLARALPQHVGHSRVPVASLEDLVFMKIISERPKDLDDALRLIRRHRASVDQAYLTPLLEEIAAALDRPEIFALYRDALSPTAR